MDPTTTIDDSTGGPMNYVALNSTMISRKLLLAGGNFIPAIGQFAMRTDDVDDMWGNLREAIHMGDLLFLIWVALFTVPTFANLFGCAPGKPNEYLYQIASHISQAAKLAMVVYLVDCLVVVLYAIGYNFSTLSAISRGFAKMLYVCWLAQRASVFKRYLLAQAFSRRSDRLGRASTIDRLLDSLIFCCTGFFLLDILNVDMGVGVTSIFAFGSAGTLVIGLATQNLAAMFVNGLVLTTSERIAEGDFIEFGNGNGGKVEKIGWFQTTLKHYDELFEIIPNSELGMQRVTNLSRVERCRIKQFLRFRYEDADKLEKLLPDILDAIELACPKVIRDGSAPFRACWSDFKEDHLLVFVDVHFDLPPMGTEYWENRQACLKAIYDTAKEHGAEFVVGLYPQGINN